MPDSCDPEQQEQCAGGGTQDSNTANVPGHQAGSSFGNNQQDNSSTQTGAAQSEVGFGALSEHEDPLYSSSDSWYAQRDNSQRLTDNTSRHQQGQDYSYLVQPLPLGSGSIRPQQPQETVDSTNLVGAPSDSPPLHHEDTQDHGAQNQQAQSRPKVQPILSVMNLKDEPGYEEEYLFQAQAWMYMTEKGSPPEIPDRGFRDPDNEAAEETQGGPIPSVMARGQHHTEPKCQGQDPSDEP